MPRMSEFGWGDLLRRMGTTRVLVLGDMVADEYITGKPDRISREAPVLILTHTEQFVRPGGATNAAYNLSRLGAQTQVIGVVGDDHMGHRLRTLLEDLGIDTRGLLIDSGRPTSTKTRILAKGTQEVQQQIVRIDRVDEREVDGALRDRTIEAVLRALQEVDALLISDYENGVIGSEVIEACLPEARRHGVTVIVDSHGDLFRFKGVTAATPNQPEAESMFGHPFRTEHDLVRAGGELLDGMEARGVLVTRGSEGVALFERDRDPFMLPVAFRNESEVVDPTGAGDTVAAVFTLALTAGASMRTAAYLGNVAGGEVVRRIGAATLTQDELQNALQRTHLEPPQDGATW
jgi:rfaE bifunctional protein kinase chain/domain